MKKTTNFDAFAQFADAQLSKEEMKNIKGGKGKDDGSGATEAPEGQCHDLITGSTVRTRTNSSGTRRFLEDMTEITDNSTTGKGDGSIRYINCVD